LREYPILLREMSWRRKETMPNQMPSGALSAIEKAVRHHPGGASVQELVRALGAQIPRRTLQYRLKALVDRHRLVAVGRGRGVKYRMCDDGVGSSVGGKADGLPLPLSETGIPVRDPVRRVPDAAKLVGNSPDIQPGMADALDNSQIGSVSALAQDLSIVTSKLKRRLREQADPGDLTISQISVMVRLEKDGPATASSLARSEGMRPQSLGAVIAGMEAADLVTGAPDPTDRRQTLLSLTDACRQLVQEARAAREDWLTRTIQTQLSPQEQGVLTTAVELLKRIVDG
jgi:DNA-binding MarR family transcriptional regulator